MKTFSISMKNGYTAMVRFLAEDIVRIQIVPQGSGFTDSALNRYHFITEPDEAGEIQSVDKNGVNLFISNKLKLYFDDFGRLSCSTSDDTRLLEMTGLELGRVAAQVSFLAQPEENWVGFGDLTRKHLYHRGHRAICWVSNVASYLPVPFFMSTQGYSVLVNTTHCVAFDMCASQSKVFSWRDERGVVDFYLMKSATFKEGIRQYTRLTGVPKLPPEWAFGLWYICRTQANDAEVMNDAYRFRQLQIPCDLIGLEPGWMEKNYDASVEKTWSHERFPLPEWQKNGVHTFIQALKRMGFHLELWLCNEYDLSFEEERKIATDLPSEEHHADSAFVTGTELDLHFTQPRYMDQITRREEPWFEHLKKFVDWGADFFKQDGAYQVCSHPDRLYGNGMTDAEMHNLYPLLYARQMWEGFAQYANRRPVVFTVSGWSGFQAWCGTWTGDTGGRLETLGAMLNTAMLGHCWATNDMEVMQPEGIHFGYLQPWSQINSWTYFRMPWLQGDRLLAMHQFYARLRSTLIPYLYSTAYESTHTAVPLMRPLTLEFQSDPDCREILHEYLLGRDLLVGIYQHDLYLPNGKWKDYWTGEVFEGGRHIHFEWPEDRGGALFVREGAIVPLGPVMQYRREKPLDHIRLYLFPGKNSTEFSLYEDDGVTFKYLDGDFALTKITLSQTSDAVLVSIAKQPDSAVRSWKLIVALPASPQSVVCNGKAVSEWSWDAERRELTCATGPGETVITL